MGRRRFRGGRTTKPPAQPRKRTQPPTRPCGKSEFPQPRDVLRRDLPPLRPARQHAEGRTEVGEPRTDATQTPKHKARMGCEKSGSRCGTALSAHLPQRARSSKLTHEFTTARGATTVPRGRTAKPPAQPRRRTRSPKRHRGKDKFPHQRDCLSRDLPPMRPARQHTGERANNATQAPANTWRPLQLPFL